MSDERSTRKPLTIAMVRDITAKLKAANDAQPLGCGWLRIGPDGTVEHIPIEEVMIWGDPEQ